MPTYKVTDPTTGRKVSLTGDSPPTEQELNDIFANLPAKIESPFMGGLRGKDEYGGLGLSNIKEELGQSAGPLVLGALGSLGGPAVGALGAAAGRAAQNAYQASLGKDIGPVGAVASPALEGAAQYYGGKYLPAVAEGAMGLAGKAGRSFASTMSGVGRDLLDRIAIRPDQVLGKMGEGALEMASDTMREALKKTVGTASEMYDDVIKAVLNHTKYGEGWRFPIQDTLGPAFDKTRKEFGFNVPTRFGAAEGEADIFNSIANTAREIGWGTAEQVYNFQRDLNAKIAQHSGTPLGAALSRVKSTLKDELGRSVPEIGQANRIYATLKPLEDFAEGAATKENLTAYIRNAAKDPSRQSARQLSELAAEFPRVGAEMDALLDSVAGSAVKDYIPQSMVRTGLTGSIVAGAGTLNPAALGAVPFMSPRLVGLATAYGSQAGQRIGQALGTPAAGAVGAQVGGYGQGQGMNAIQEAYRRRQLSIPPR